MWESNPHAGQVVCEMQPLELTRPCVPGLYFFGRVSGVWGYMVLARLVPGGWQVAVAGVGLATVSWVVWVGTGAKWRDGMTICLLPWGVRVCLPQSRLARRYMYSSFLRLREKRRTIPLPRFFPRASQSPLMEPRISSHYI